MTTTTTEDRIEAVEKQIAAIQSEVYERLYKLDLLKGDLAELGKSVQNGSCKSMTTTAEMDTIELTKINGAIRALKDRIDRLHFELTNRNWEAITKDGRYSRLEEAIGDARIILNQMHNTLIALQELEPDNK